MCKKICVFATMIFLALGFITVSATEQQDVVLSLEINNPVMIVNGNQKEIDPGRNTAPVIVNGRTLVPIRAIIEEFNGTVGWDEPSKTVTLSVYDDVVKLVIDSKTAYYNGKAHQLDVAPAVINERTMLPIRFIAQSFNFGIAWDDKTQTVSVIRDTFTDIEYQNVKKMIPDYYGKAYVEINNNVPFFKDYEKKPGSFEYYSSLDELGRCDVCFASVSEDLMPQGERESISSVTPTGWLNKKYDIVPGGYLYNRSHLIGYQLTGENANKRNLITGTRYMNVNGMLPIENMADDYVESSDNRLLYRVTPVFSGDNLVADGVLIEGCSIGNSGIPLSFCVYCYNVQPGVFINYKTGDSSSNSFDIVNEIDEPVTGGDTVYITPTGKRYHISATCGGKNSYSVVISVALDKGLTPCQKCYK